MNWEAVGAIAELLGAVAVLSTLVYLAVQIRQNAQSLDRQSDIARAQILQRRADSVAQLASIVTTVPENIEMMARLQNEPNISRSDLSETENARATMILTMLRANLENTFLQYQQGFLPEDFYREVGVKNNASYAKQLLEFDMPLTESFRSELIRNIEAQDDT